MLNAILGNVGTFVVFRVGIDDATKLQPMFYPYFRDLDIKELPNWQAYVRLRMERKVIPPFNIETILDGAACDNEVAERIRERSRRRHAKPVKQVEDEIAKMLEFINNIDWEE